MIIHIVSAFILLVTAMAWHPADALVSVGGSSIAPYKISFNSLESAVVSTTSSSSTDAADSATTARLLLDGLTNHNNGLVSITNLPNNFKQVKLELLSNLHACLMSIEQHQQHVIPTEHLVDGTIRRSFATSTLPNENNGGRQQRPIHSLELFLESISLSSTTSIAQSCIAFQNNLATFRSTVDVVTTKFAQQLSFELESYLPKPLLHSAATEKKAGGHDDYLDIAQTVARGEHLEHFHSYQKKTTSQQLQQGSDVAGSVEEASSTTTTTIELHTDQGFFIAFTPGLLLPTGGVVDAATDDEQAQQLLALSKGLYIQDSNGNNYMVEFTNEDDLVFMMGDGVNQVINAQLLHGHTGLRATPHALVLDTQDEGDLARVWYGRMVLPPNDAYSPLLPDFTFGQHRQSLVHSATNGEDVLPLGIGCSSPTLQTVIAATSRRSLSEEAHGSSTITCAQDELFCWFGCMALSDYNITSAESCTERNLSLECMNPRGQVHENGMEHGDFFPACTNRTYESHPVTPFPTIDAQDEDMCTADLWNEFVMEESYEHKATLTRPNGTETILLWSVADNGDGTKKLKARLAFNNVFGWLAIGFANQMDVILNGMHGGNVLLAMPGGNYSAATGMDLSVGGSIATYKIDESETSFRHWQTPIETDETKTTVADFEDSGCFTALTFESDHINGQAFNLDGTDDMIWAGNHNDIWMGYHGPFDRARFVIDWNKDEEVLFSGEDNLDETETETVDAGVVSSAGGFIERDLFGMTALAFAMSTAVMLNAFAF